MAFGMAGAIAGGGVLGQVAVELVGDSSRLRKDVARARKDVGAGTVAMEKRAAAMATAWKTAGLVAGAALVAFGISAVKAFKEAQLVTAQTEAVLKSTGGQANVTKAQILDLASSLRDLSGVEDETIQSGANMLLTFTKIRNEVGAGNDIFNQATKATLNLSVAMGKDMQSSAILVGKALNDPVLGMTALTRAGVQFDASQKQTIKTLIEAGDRMGAQKIILGELETQFGKSAEAAGKTFAGKLNILKSQFGDLQESVGGFIVGGLQPLVSGFVKLPGPIKTLIAGVIGLTVVMVALAAVVKTVRNAFAFLIPTAGSAAAGFAAMASKAAILPAILMTVGAGLGSLVRNLTNTVTAEQALISVTGQLQAAVASGEFTWKQIQGAVDKYNQTIGALPGAQQLSIDSFRNLAGGIGELPPELATAGDAIDDWEQKASEDLHSVSGVLSDLAGQANLSAGDIIKAFVKQTKAITAYEANMETLRARNVPDALLQQLAGMGLEGKRIVEILASANEKDFKRIGNSILKAMGMGDQYIAMLGRIPRSIHTTVSFDSGNVPDSKRDAAGFHGVVRKPQWHLVGEAGPERVDVTPLSQLRRGMNAPASSAGWAGAPARGDNYFTVQIMGDVNDADRFTQKVEAALTRAASRFAGV